MRKIKNYFASWDSSRYLRLVLGITLGLAYAFDGQGFYLLLSVFFLVQAVMNIGCGCATNGNCATNTKNDKESAFQFEELNNNKNV